MELFKSSRFFFLIMLAAAGKPKAKEVIDKAIEENLTNKLTEDLIQSLEMKFQSDLESSVDVVLTKIKNLLQNGTSQINAKLMQIQSDLEVMQNVEPDTVAKCLQNKTSEKSVVIERALHQMVLCGYALIGHDPAQALAKVMEIKQSIRKGLKPVGELRKEVHDLLQVCGHDHDSMKKVVKCVISKSPVIKTAMMHITSLTVNGIVQLTKLMAHGAMHEACLIEVVKSVEDEAEVLLADVKTCAFGNPQADSFDGPGNLGEAVRLEFSPPTTIATDLRNNDEVSQMKSLLDKMLKGSEDNNSDLKFRRKLQRLRNSMKSNELNML